MSRGEAQIRELGQPGDLGWVVMAHGEIYAQEFGWNAEFEKLVLQIVADFVRDATPTPSAAWIAELGKRRVGCVFCVPTPSRPSQSSESCSSIPLPAATGSVIA